MRQFLPCAARRALGLTLAAVLGLFGSACAPLSLTTPAGQEIVTIGRIVCVAPNGTAEGDGTEQKPLDLVTAFAARSPARPGDTILLQAGTYEGALKGAERAPFVLAVSGGPGKPIRVKPAPGAAVHLNGALSIDGSYVWVVGLEIGDLTWDLKRATRPDGAGVNLGATHGVKVINCNIFGASNGITALASAVDCEFYGCLVHDVGSSRAHDAPAPGSTRLPAALSNVEGAGSAICVQNAEGVKVVSNCMAWRSGGVVMLRGQAGAGKGVEITRNFFFPAGAAALSDLYDNFITFDERQKLAKDGRPAGTKVFILPNRYQSNRAHVGIFNWDGRTEADMDMSGALAQGVRYAVYHVLDIKQTLALAKPVLTGTCHGGTVRVPLRKDPACPDFDAFLVAPAPK